MMTVSAPDLTPAPPLASAPVASYSRAHPFLAELVRHDRLTSPGSLKDTRHFVVNLAGSGLSYAPGDSLGAFGRNSPGVVDELIEVLGFAPAAPVHDPKGRPTTFRRALLADYIVNRSNGKLLRDLAQRLRPSDQRNRLQEIVSHDGLLAEYIETRDYVDILREFDLAAYDCPADFLAQLTPIAPRLYSIASSPLAHPDEAHLCVAVVRYDTHGRPKKGLASGFLADHADMFVRNVPVYIQPSRHFHLPQNRAADIIMIGPGTGIAPFRAFLEHRIAEGATGRHWLFFGERNHATDFLYRDELLAWQRGGRLHRLDLAFSRDQPHKIYVQHRMLEAAAELWAWLQNGAYLYVCGDAHQMAKEVHQTLVRIACEQGALAPAAAEEYVNVTLMKTEKRYLRDVY